MVSSPSWQTRRLRVRGHARRGSGVRGSQAVQAPKSGSYLSCRSDSMLFWSLWSSVLICLETLII